ncbi:hypothetical protein BDK51DRAFT_49006 [Blyttiomyces helicus]|uniref:Uncharacterized protein n=1 Tax=Blyttiomyces helicus TaxID=388810 RepID=A0A4P9WE47_9FUNG|nr:hypothetical protein BDK51DRAFT_49006 [Blyttiomyces helicus]|eukprot:RKO89963.1 hypothetical protein BDK51DRAFT_49006 [Blyttiomyces helicus]
MPLPARIHADVASLSSGSPFYVTDFLGPPFAISGDPSSTPLATWIKGGKPLTIADKGSIRVAESGGPGGERGAPEQAQNIWDPSMVRELEGSVGRRFPSLSLPDTGLRVLPGSRSGSRSFPVVSAFWLRVTASVRALAAIYSACKERGSPILGPIHQRATPHRVVKATEVGVAETREIGAGAEGFAGEEARYLGELKPDSDSRFPSAIAQRDCIIADGEQEKESRMRKHCGRLTTGGVRRE